MYILGGCYFYCKLDLMLWFILYIKISKLCFLVFNVLLFNCLKIIMFKKGFCGYVCVYCKFGFRFN